MHLRVELHGPNAPLLVGDSGQGVGGGGDAMESGGQFQRFVAVAHPHLECWRQPGKERRCGVFDGDFGMSVLALGRRAHLAAQVMHDEVETVADSQHRNVQREDLRVGCRRVQIVNRGWPAGEDDSQRLVRLNLGERHSAGQNNGKNVQFANSPRNQLRVLRTKIKDNDSLGVHSPVWQGYGRDVKTKSDRCPTKTFWLTLAGRTSSTRTKFSAPRSASFRQTHCEVSDVCSKPTLHCLKRRLLRKTKFRFSHRSRTQP